MSNSTQKDTRGGDGSCVFNLTDMPVKIIVGPSRCTFYVAPSVLDRAGTFLSTALKKEWKGGQERAVELREDDSNSFRLYAEWLSTGTIFCKTDKLDDGNCEKLIGLYILGEKMLDRTFQDGVMDALLAAYRGGTFVLHVEDVDQIYEHTPAGSPIRRFVVDCHVRWAFEHDNEEWASGMSQVNHEFVVDLLQASFEWRKLSTQAKIELDKRAGISGCAYHHDKDESCKGAKV